MPVVPMREILDAAFAERYGVAAINVVDDLTLEAVLAAATELESPLIVQTSLKTVKSIGATASIQHVACAGRRGADPGVAASRPLSRPRMDHDLPARRAGTRCCSTAPRSTSARTRARRSRWWRRPSDYGAQVEGEIESVLGVEDGVGSDEAGRGASRRGLGAVHRGDRGLLVRPGDRHGARSLQARAGAQAGARHRARRATPDPDGAARRHRPERGAVHAT